ncbi:MAG TPA: tetratricopeptide repeat protein [candidate division Zixibacteria bacterium]|nr:tetratricopeptide repeat protein [candidate division Zixibacteria bacterium]
MRKTILAIIFTILLALSVFANISRDVELARRYVALGKFEEARALLEPLFETHSEDAGLRLLLKQTYHALRDNASLLRIIEAEIADDPNNANLWIELGNVALAMGDSDKAKRAYNTAVELVPHDEAKILAIYRSYMTWGYTKEAVELLLAARKRSGNKGAFALEIASVYEISNEWTKAADEYALYLEQFPDRFTDIERRMNEVSANEDQLDDLIQAVIKLRDKGIEGDRIDRMLARLLARKGDYMSAVRSLIDAETKRRAKGIYVLGFMREMLSANAHDAVIFAGNYLADAEPRFSLEASLIMSYSLRATGKIADAEKTLAPLAKGKTPNIAAEALVLLGTISLEDRDNPKAAKGYFAEAIEKYARFPETATAYRGLVEVHLREDDLTAVEQILTQRRATAPDDPWALFGLGELAFFRGAIDTAGMIFREVVLSFPRSSEANNAVEYLALMADAGQSGDIELVISAFSALRKGDLPLALARFDTLIEKHSSQPWADILLWERAHIRLKTGDRIGCQTDLNSIAELFPEGYHASQAIEKLGDLALEDGDPTVAVRYYNRILADYKNAVNLERVRDKLRRIPGNI